MSAPRVLICPPTGPGSLGDEAMMVALAARLTARGFVVDAMPPFADGGTWDHLPEVTAHVPYPDGGAPRTVARLFALVRRYERVYVLGADVLDGHYDDRTVRRLLLAASAARLAGRPTTIVGFSYNANPSRTSVRLARLLPPGTRILLRDRSSLERFRSATGRRAALTSDVAFLLDPAADLGEDASDLEGWIARMHDLGRAVVVFNGGGASYVPGLGQADPERVAAAYAAELSSLLAHRPEVAVALVAHDHRVGVGEHDLLRAVRARIDPEVRDRVAALITPRLRASEVKRLLTDVDLVCTGRMHLAVAALGVGTPAVCMTYQNKFAGLYDHFGLEPLTVTHDEALRPGTIEALISKSLDVADELRAAVLAARTRVQSLAERNVV